MSGAFGISNEHKKREVEEEKEENKKLAIEKLTRRANIYSQPVEIEREEIIYDEKCNFRTKIENICICTRRSTRREKKKKKET